MASAGAARRRTRVCGAWWLPAIRCATNAATGRPAGRHASRGGGASTRTSARDGCAAVPRGAERATRERAVTDAAPDNPQIGPTASIAVVPFRYTLHGRTRGGGKGRAGRTRDRAVVRRFSEMFRDHT